MVIAKKLSSDLESPHFLTLSANYLEYIIGERDGHGKSRNGHGKVIEKYFVKSVGTLKMIHLNTGGMCKKNHVDKLSWQSGVDCQLYMLVIYS